ncbi:MAG: SUF system NifU family Fe-S cluster assembly protein [Rhodospirillales bacterium]|nr:SUF system NifU family Fe-S cluster assembly protein [Rhodospirillales bacterium]
MSSELRELYQEVILDHGREPRNFGKPEAANHHAHGHNPLCGDKVTIYLEVADGLVRDVGFEGSGCAISMASTSLMTETIKGRPIEEAHTLFRHFHDLMTGSEDGAGEEVDEDAFERLSVLSGVREFPMRVKCATLCWHTMEAAVKGDQTEVSSDE